MNVKKKKVGNIYRVRNITIMEKDRKKITECITDLK